MVVLGACHLEWHDLADIVPNTSVGALVVGERTQVFSYRDKDSLFLKRTHLVLPECIFWFSVVE